MGCDHHVICGQRLSFISISLFFLIVSSWTLQGFVTEEGSRKTLKQNGFQQTVLDDKAMRARIGSRPPKCERRCRSCGPCEAIQVPTNPQVQKGMIYPSTVSTSAYARGEDNFNYKPMSWKCKCGNLIFNP